MYNDCLGENCVGFTVGVLDFDFALLELDCHVRECEPVTLPPSNATLLTGTAAIVNNWHDGEFAWSIVSFQGILSGIHSEGLLRSVSVRVLNRAECAIRFEEEQASELDASEICAQGIDGGVLACVGDGDSALVYIVN